MALLNAYAYLSITSLSVGGDRTCQVVTFRGFICRDWLLLVVSDQMGVLLSSDVSCVSRSCCGQGSAKLSDSPPLPIWLPFLMPTQLWVYLRFILAFVGMTMTFVHFRLPSFFCSLTTARSSI